MILPIYPKYRKRPGREKRATAAPPAVALVLVSAVYNDSELELYLTFDRAVNVDAFDGTQVSLVVNPGERVYQTFDPELIDPVTLGLALTMVGSQAGSGVVLTASALTGIVAVDDGAAWAGVSGLELPFP